MADLTKSADALITEVTASVKKEILAQLAPITQRIASAASDLEAALAGTAGRKRGGRKPGPKPGKRKVGRPAKKAAKVTIKRTKRAKRNPRGTLQACIRKCLGPAKTGLTLAGIRDGVLKMPAYRGRNGKTLYTQIVQAVKKMPDISKGAKGKYSVKRGKK